MDGYDKLVPSPTPDTQPYWDGLNEGRLRLQRCADCGKVRHYPAAGVRCLLLDERRTGSTPPASGTVHSWTITHHAFHPGFKGDLPYMLLTVDLAEGVRMNAQARGIDAATLRVGLPVKVAFEHAKDDLTLPVFVAA